MSIDLKKFTPRKILVCQLRQIGDVVLTTPSITLLHNAYPHARIDVLTEKKCTPVFENNPRIAKLWSLDKKKLQNFAKALVFYHRVASSGYDLIVDFQQLPRLRFVVAMSRAKVKLTYTPPWYNRWMYTHWTEQIDRYAAQCKASVLEPLGIVWDGEKPEIFLTEKEKKWAADYLKSLGISTKEKLITVDPSHRSITRRWPAAHFGNLIRLALESEPDLKFIVLYGPGEKETASQVLEMAGSIPGIFIPQEMLSLRQMAALLGAANLHLGNCSAPSHIATALDTATLIVRGSTDKDWSYPSSDHVHVSLDLKCQPCGKEECSLGLKCLWELTPEKVLPALIRILENQAAS